MLKWFKECRTGRYNYNYRITTDNVTMDDDIISIYYYPNQDKIWFTFDSHTISFPTKKDTIGFFKDVGKELSKAFDEVKK